MGSEMCIRDRKRCCAIDRFRHSGMRARRHAPARNPSVRQGTRTALFLRGTSIQICFLFAIHMYCSRWTEGNCQRVGDGDRTWTGMCSNHPLSVFGVPTPHVCCRTIGACRAPPLTYYGMPGTLVPDRQQRSISTCFNETKWAYHAPACTSFPPDTVEWGPNRTFVGKTGPNDATR